MVIAILGLLSAIIMVALGSARDSGKLAAAKSFAAHTYRAFGADAIGLWNFDNNANIGIDTSWRNNNGAATSFSASTVDDVNTYGNRGNSIKLTGTEYIRIINNTSLRISTGTVAAWIKTTNASGLMAIAVMTGHYGLAIENGILKANPGPTAVGNAFVADGKWHYVAVSFRYSFSPTVSENISLYLDGKLLGNLTPVTVPLTTFTNDFTIGASHSGTVNYVGNVDDVALYSQSLTASEIYNLYASQASKYGIALSP